MHTQPLVICTVFYISALIAFSSAHAASLSEKALFSRCYAQVTGVPVPLNHSLFAQVKSGQIKAVDACLSILNKGKLSGSGSLINEDTEGVRVLNNFYQFHRTWFASAFQNQISGFQAEFDSPTDSFVELTTPALTMTRALLADGVRYSQILQGNQSFVPLRGATGTRSLSMMSPDGSVSVQNAQIAAPFSGGGLIRGIANSPSPLVLSNYSIPTVGNAVGAQAETNIDLYRSLGGGILGQQSYFLLNVGHVKGQIFDGAIKLPRKWAVTTYEKLMCFTLPALRESDVASMVETSGQATFRTARSCVTCHATMDQFATVGRNWVVAETAEGNFQKSIMVGSFSGNMAAHPTWSASAVENFHRQNPSGKIYIRSYSTGQLVDRSVANVEDLGTKLSEMDELYQCAAKKYFQYFTGINVSLYDRTDPANATLNRSLNSRDVADRKFVEYLGRELRQSQSLSKMIELILKSNYYNQVTFKPVE